MSWFKALTALLGLLDFVAGQIERAQLRAAGKTEAQRDALEKIVEAIGENKALENRLRSDPSLLGRLRRHYNRQ